jgi:hypothetical protein
MERKVAPGFAKQKTPVRISITPAAILKTLTFTSNFDIISQNAIYSADIHYIIPEPNRQPAAGD